MARALEQHPDYKILRRLKPVLHFAGEASQCQRVLILDTETTGLDPKQDQIIELALLGVKIDLATGLPVGEVQIYDGLEDPGRPIPPTAKEITGIDDEMVRGQRLDEARIAALLASADLVIAHNAGFDRPFVEARLPAFREKAWACSLQGIDWKTERGGSASLEALAAGFGWFYDAHRAEVDCHALLQVLTQPLRTDGQTGLARLVVGAAQSSFRLRATGAPFESKDQLKARGYRWDAERRVWSCELRSEALLQAECDWLKEHAYGGRAARVEVEQLDSRVRYAARPGDVSVRSL